MGNITQRDLDAIKINAMLHGMNPDDATEAIVNSINDEEDNNKSKSTKPKKQNNKKQSTTKDKVPKDDGTVPNIEFFSKLKDAEKIMVTFGEHDIHYKEQLWGIPSRNVEYTLELVKSRKIARDISDAINGVSDEYRTKADKGYNRYYRLITYENVLHKVKEIAYIKIYKGNSKIKYRILIKNELLKSSEVNTDKLKNNLKLIMERMLEDA